MEQEKLQKQAIFLSTQLDNNKSNLHTIISNNEIGYANQVEGLGEVSRVDAIKVDVSRVINKNSNGNFRLDITLNIEGLEYSYSRIYTISNVPDNGIVLVGNIGLVGEVNQEEIEVKAIITNIITV